MPIRRVDGVHPQLAGIVKHVTFNPICYDNPNWLLF